mmetsp:Transcript_48249/g.151610  ORF Transcript_48249/g.151610 Transcript_48249/m.151610 type:complete len:290 (+) Transcript_48249:433-1302(+)
MPPRGVGLGALLRARRERLGADKAAAVVHHDVQSRDGLGQLSDVCQHCPKVQGVVLRPVDVQDQAALGHHGQGLPEARVVEGHALDRAAAEAQAAQVPGRRRVRVQQLAHLLRAGVGRARGHDPSAQVARTEVGRLSDGRDPLDELALADVLEVVGAAGPEHGVGGHIHRGDDLVPRVHVGRQVLRQVPRQEGGVPQPPLQAVGVRAEEEVVVRVHDGEVGLQNLLLGLCQPSCLGSLSVRPRWQPVRLAVPSAEDRVLLQGIGTDGRGHRRQRSRAERGGAGARGRDP